MKGGNNSWLTVYNFCLVMPQVEHTVHSLANTIPFF